MKQIRLEWLCLGMSFVLCLSGCSKKPEAPAAKVPEKTLIEVLYDATKFYANGGKTFNAPQGIVIDTSEELMDGNRVPATGTVRISGVQQKGKSVAVINFNLPGTWLTSEKQRLSGLESEIKELTACASKLIEKGRTGEIPKNDADSCRMKEVTVNGRPAITISDVKAPHVEMVMSAAQ